MTRDDDAPVPTSNRRPPPLPPQYDHAPVDSISPAAIDTVHAGPRRGTAAMAVVFGTLAGALGALSLRPITQPRTAALLSQLDAGRDAGVPDGGDAQAPMLIVWVEDVRWQPPRDYPPFDRRAAAAALEAAATGMAERCDLADSELHAPAAITFAPSGIVVRAEVGGALTESDRRACVERWLELAEMPPFAAPARELRRTVDMR